MSLDFHWTDKETRSLRRLWAEGHSASVIARRIPGKSRNAVIGKVHRLNLGKRPTVVKIIKVRFRTRPLPAAPCIPGSTPLVDLTPDACRYPIGDPKDKAFGFCGCAKVEGSSYCDLHERLTHNRKPDRHLAQFEAEPMREAA